MTKKAFETSADGIAAKIKESHVNAIPTLVRDYLEANPNPRQGIQKAMFDAIVERVSLQGLSVENDADLFDRISDECGFAVQLEDLLVKKSDEIRNASGHALKDEIFNAADTTYGGYSITK